MERAALDRRARAVIAIVLVVTGAAALVSQIVWQRVIALHAGVDLESSTTVVTAFLAGLGIGNLIGGRIADRIQPRQALWVLGGAEAGVALCSLSSIWLLYDLYRELVPNLESTPARLLFNLTVLLVPTALMGMSLPLVARAVTTDASDAGSQVGRFQAANTSGAAVGAMVGGWLIIGSFGFSTVMVIVAAGQLVAAMLFVGLARSTTAERGRRTTLVSAAAAVAVAVVVDRVAVRALDGIDHFARLAEPAAFLAALAAATLTVLAFRPQATSQPSISDPDPGTEADDAQATDPTVRPDEPVLPPGPAAEPHPIPRWVWYLAYGITGAVAIGFEQVFFRLVDGIMRSNTYTFGHVLSLYLALLAVGAAIGSWVRPRVRDHQRAFLWIQFGVGASAGIAVLVFTEVLPSIGLGDEFTQWFSSGGFNEGFIGTRRLDELLFGLGIPLLIMGIPVLLMGSAFPFAQGLVTDDLETVGSRTGTLLVANLAGNVAGALLTTFVLIEHVGTMGSYRGLLIPLAIAGVIAALLSPGRRARVAQAIGVIVVMAAIAFALPSNLELWAMLHATPKERLALAESRSCTSALQLDGDQFMLTINGSGQNGYPFDDFHVLIGLLPVLAHPDPEAGAAIGLGAGSTSYAMLLDQRLDHLRSVELCSGHARLFQDHADRGVPEFVELTTDGRHEMITGDGRRHLLASDEPYDIIVPDTMRPNSAGSGNLYSREFQELVSDRLSDDGLTAGWIPSPRVFNAVSTTYPHAVMLSVDQYNGSQFYVASKEPFLLDPDVLLERFDTLRADALPADQRARLRTYIANLDPVCMTDGQTAEDPAAEAENRDLHPRDEYFLTNRAVAEDELVRTCG